MKIAYLTNQYPKVSHTFIRREIEALEADGVEVVRYSVRPCPDELADEADRRELDRTRVLLPPGAHRWVLPLVTSMAITVLTRPRRFWTVLRMAVRLGNKSDVGLMLHLAYLAEACLLRRLVHRQGCDHLHAHFGNNPAAVALLTRLLGGPPYSFTAHGSETLDRLESAGIAEKVAGSAFTVAVSDFTRAQLVRFSDPADHARIHVVRCGLDDAYRAAPPPPVEAPRRLVCVARLSVEKGLGVLIEATASLVRSGETVELVLVGDGPKRAEIEARLRADGLEDVVTITGWLSGAGVRERIGAARALVLPSFAEGLPVVIMESLAMGRPVIATYVAGVPELVEPGVTGWLVPVGSVESLAEAMRAALSATPAELTRMGEAGARRVAAQHDVTTEARKLAALFEQRPVGTRAGAAREARVVETPSPSTSVGH